MRNKTVFVRPKPIPPATRSGVSKQTRRMQEGVYEPALWTRVQWFRGVPLDARKQTLADRRKDPMGPKERVFIQKHYHSVIYALDAVVSRQTSDLRTQMTDGWDNHSLLVEPTHIGFKGATKLASVKLLERVRRAPVSWWKGLDRWAEHIDVLNQAGQEVLVEWLRTYKP